MNEGIDKQVVVCAFFRVILVTRTQVVFRGSKVGSGHNIIPPTTGQNGLIILKLGRSL